MGKLKPNQLSFLLETIYSTIQNKFLASKQLLLSQIQPNFGHHSNFKMLLTIPHLYQPTLK